MGKLPGIEKLDFDCKTATLTMKEGTTLSREAATEAIVKAGFGVTKFEGGEAPKVTAYVFRVTGIDAAKPSTAAAKVLNTALDSPDFVAVDATGAAAMTFRGDKKLSKEALATALREAGFGFEEILVREWPKTYAAYTMELPDVTDVAAAKRARAALVALEKVFWAEVHPETKCAVIFLNEPCSEIEVKVRGSLGNLGYAVPQFRLEKP